MFATSDRWRATLGTVFSLALCHTVVPAVAHEIEKAQAKRPTTQTPKVVLSTIPRHVYKVVDRIDTQEANECWYVHVVVDDTRTPARVPLSASVTLYSGSTVRTKMDARHTFGLSTRQSWRTDVVGGDAAASALNLSPRDPPSPRRGRREADLVAHAGNVSRPMDGFSG